MLLLWNEVMKRIRSVPPSTVLLYHWNNIPYSAKLPNGPGGIIVLNEKNTVELLQELLPKAYYGQCSAQLTTTQLVNSKVIQSVLAPKATPNRVHPRM